jgi:hypothetical protein
MSIVRRRASAGAPGVHVSTRFLVLVLIVLLASLALPAIAAPVVGAASDLQSYLGTSQATAGDGTHHLGFKPATTAAAARFEAAGTPDRLAAGQPLGASADLSAQLPPIGDQGSQGSCVAWATSYYYKSWSEKQEHTGWNLSNAKYQFSPSFMYNQINGGGDYGSTFPDAFDLLQQKGDVDISEMPYNDNNYTVKPTSTQLEAAKPYRIASGWSYLWLQNGLGPFSQTNDIAKAKAWLAQGKLLVMGIPVYYDFPDFGGSGARAYYDYNGSAQFAGGHGVCICGYNDNINPSGADADHRGGFKMVNSWGSYWNGSSKGYVWLSYDFVKRYVWEGWTMTDLTGDGPTISSLSAASGNAGGSITISGNNFGAKRRNASVTFNGTAATQATFTNSSITATVPSGATSGQVVAYDWDGAASNSMSFMVDNSGGGATLPVTGGISPGSGKKGALVTISGNGFGSARGSSTVKFGTVSVPAGSYVSWSDTSLAVKVPGGVGGKPIVTVATAAGTSNGVAFKVIPQISTMSPASGRPGTVITITGQGFGTSKARMVYFGSKGVTAILSWSNTKMRVRVPGVAPSWVHVKVRTVGGTSSGKPFKVTR